MTANEAALRQTPLHSAHVALGAKMVPFAGFDMPVSYPAGISAEHKAVRERVGLFDVPHMGEFEITGPDRNAFVQKITSNDVGALVPGQAQYSALLTARGTFVDDLLVYRFQDKIMLVVNASNIIKAAKWIVGQIEGMGDAVAVNTSSRYALLALQGPAARGVLQTLTGVNLDELKYYWFTTGEVASVMCTISRTGYTGEDGFEVFVAPASAERVWDAILNAGKGAGVVPAGLGARDTLRLEAAMRLYGNDIDETTTVVEADLGWIVGWKKTEFLGADVLRKQRAEGPARKLAGFEVLDRAIARHGHDVYVDGQKAGVVTSGTQTPFLKKSIGMAYLPADRTAPETEFEIDIRGRRTRAKVVPMPFYKRPRT